MSWFLCAFWPYLAGALIAWLVAGVLAHRFKYQPAPRAQIVERPSAPVGDEGSPSASPDLDAARAAGFMVEPDDELSVIHGIGPAIAAHLRAAGIATLPTLAATPCARLAVILDTGEGDIALASAETWPAQANLAMNNCWSALKRWQAALEDPQEASE